MYTYFKRYFNVNRCSKFDNQITVKIKFNKFVFRYN